MVSLSVDAHSCHWHILQDFIIAPLPTPPGKIAGEFFTISQKYVELFRSEANYKAKKMIHART